MLRDGELQGMLPVLVSKTAFAVLAVASCLTVALEAAPRGDGNTIALVFAPWTAAAAAVARATNTGGTLVRLGAYPFVVIVHPGAGGASEVAACSGAWLAIDASLIRGCGRLGGLRA